MTSSPSNIYSSFNGANYSSSAGNSPIRSPSVLNGLRIAKTNVSMKQIDLNHHSPAGSPKSMVKSSLSASRIALNSSQTSTPETGDSIDRSLWTIKALKEHPEIVDIIDRVKPITRGISLAQDYASEDTLLKDDPLIGHDAMLQLILQHLQFEGLMESRAVLEEEAKVKSNDYPFEESRLMTLLRTAVKDSERIFQLTLDESPDSQTQLEEHLAFMGLLREDPLESGEDLNIYDEPEESNTIYIEEKEKEKDKDKDLNGSPRLTKPLGTSRGIEESKIIKAASLNKLVMLITTDKNHDLEFTKTFLLTYQSFTTPEKLFHKLVQRYQVPVTKLQKLELNEYQIKSQVNVIQLRVVNTLKTWIREYFSDFNERLIQLVKSFCEMIKHKNKSLAIQISEMLNNKIKLNDDEDKRKSIFATLPPDPKVPSNIWSQNLDIFDIDEEEMARQLTLHDFEIFSSIKPTELLNQSWNKPKLRHRSPNVLALINRFNEISQWAASSILNYSRVRDRAKIMAKFVKIADYSLKSLNNFNMSMAILSGLNAASVHRLKFTREEMPRNIQQTYTDLQTLLSNAFSYREYRNLLAKANPPAIPYLGVHLTDLTFVEEGNPDNIQGLINFSKRRLVYQTISIVLRLQNSKYNLQPVYQISKLLRVLKPRMDEDELYRRSMKFEPRNKERNEIL